MLNCEVYVFKCVSKCCCYIIYDYWCGLRWVVCFCGSGGGGGEGEAWSSPVSVLLV